MAVATNQPDGTVLMPEPEAITEAASIIDELQAQLETVQTENEGYEKQIETLKADLKKAQDEIAASKKPKS